MKWYSIIILFLVASCAVNKSTQSLHPYTGEMVGCGNFVVYKLTADNKEYVSVAFNASDLEWVQNQAFGVGVTDRMEVIRRKFDSPINGILCSDVINEMPRVIEEEIATAGVVEFIVNAQEIDKAKKKEEYQVTVILKKVLFEGVTVDYLRLDNITVGWLPG